MFKMIRKISLGVLFLAGLVTGLFAYANDLVVAENLQAEGVEASSKEVYLLQFAQGSERQKPTADYNRQKHFGKFSKFKNQKQCYKTRAQILIRDSLVEARSTDKEPCTIEKGLWVDPFTGAKFDSADDIDVDHMVPLKEAYLSGAHQWSPTRRCVYNNFTDYKNHLQIMSTKENMSKSDKTPADYIPSERSYVCQYLKDWLSVKLIWNLSFTEREKESITDYVDRYSCDKSEFKISSELLSKLRQKITTLEKICPVSKSK